MASVGHSAPCSQVAAKAVDQASPPSKPQRSLARSNLQPPRPRITHVAADAQQHQVRDPVAVDVDRIGADHLVQFEAARLELEAQRAAALAHVAVELRRRLSAGEEDVGKAVAAAVEDGHAAADHILPLALVDAVDAGARRLIDEFGDRDGARVGDGFLRGGDPREAARLNDQQRGPETNDARGYLRVRKAFTYWPTQRPWSRPRSIAARK